MLHRPLAALLLAAAASSSSSARAETFTCGDGAGCVATIPDPGTVESTIEVASTVCPPGLPVLDLSVAVQAKHQWIGDLEITLMHESGARAVLFQRPLIDVASGGCASDDIDATFASSAFAPTTACAATIPAAAGAIVPVDDLDVFDGLSRDAAWTLSVADQSGASYGALTSWSLTFNCGDTATTVQAPATAAVGEPVTITATVVGETPLSGTVVFEDGAIAIAEATVGQGGVATFTTDTLELGTHTISATYVGDAAHAASTSAPTTLVVERGATTTTLAADQASAGFGETVIVTATVAAEFRPPTGSVSFFDGGAFVATVQSVDGAAALALDELGIGDHVFTATYGGDAATAPSDAAAVTVTVGAVATTTLLSVSSTDPLPGASVSMTASVTADSGVPSGIVEFLDGETVFATATLVGGFASATIPVITEGPHALQAKYQGAAGFDASASATVDVTAAAPGGCGCAAAGAGPSTTWAAMAALALVGGLMTRRRRVG